MRAERDLSFEFGTLKLSAMGSTIHGAQDINLAYLHIWELHLLLIVVKIPKIFKEQLSAAEVCTGRSSIHEVRKASDDTVKFLLRLHDGLVVEAVGIPSDKSKKTRLTACVSSQVSCLHCQPPHLWQFGSHQLIPMLSFLFYTFLHQAEWIPCPMHRTGDC